MSIKGGIGKSICQIIYHVAKRHCATTSRSLYGIPVEIMTQPTLAPIEDIPVEIMTQPTPIEDIPVEIMAEILNNLKGYDTATLVSVVPKISSAFGAVCADDTYGPKVRLNLFELQKTLGIRPECLFLWLESLMNKFSWVVEIDFENLKYNCYVTDDNLLNIVNMEKKPLHLTTLNLGRCDQITDTGLQHIAQLTQLRVLNLTGCDQITDTGLQYLTHITSVIT